MPGQGREMVRQWGAVVLVVLAVVFWLGWTMATNRADAQRAERDRARSGELADAVADAVDFCDHYRDDVPDARSCREAWGYMTDRFGRMPTEP